MKTSLFYFIFNTRTNVRQWKESHVRKVHAALVQLELRRQQWRHCELQVQLILRRWIVEAAAGHAHELIVAQRGGVVAKYRTTPLAVGEELRAQYVDAARVQLLDERSTAHRIAQQIAPVGQIERRRHGVKVTRREAEQIVEHEKVNVLMA